MVAKHLVREKEGVKSPLRRVSFGKSKGGIKFSWSVSGNNNLWIT